MWASKSLIGEGVPDAHNKPSALSFSLKNIPKQQYHAIAIIACHGMMHYPASLIKTQGPNLQRHCQTMKFIFRIASSHKCMPILNCPNVENSQSWILFRNPWWNGGPPNLPCGYCLQLHLVKKWNSLRRFGIFILVAMEIKIIAHQLIITTRT